MSAPTIGEFRAEARAWLERNVARRPDPRALRYGDGRDDVAVFHGSSASEERRIVEDLREWRRRKCDAGFALVSWEPEYGGRGYPPAYELVFLEEEAAFATPPAHEAVGITTDLIAPTIRAWGTHEQRERFLRPMLRTDVMWCQLFSEPGAGSDLAAIATRAVRDGDEWVIDGQKVWTSGAQFAEWGYVQCRTDPSAKHRGLTAFLVPMDAAGVEVRPLRQMTGGSSFNEVFLTGVRVPDTLRLGEVDGGWQVAMTTLGFERVAGSGEGDDLGRRFHLAATVARELGVDGDAVVRQRLAEVYTRARVVEWNNERVRSAMRAGATPGPEGSLGKLLFASGLRAVSELISTVLGPRLVADSGAWGTYAWAEHVTGAPGMRIAGGTDEIQRTIIGERVLGLPRG